MERDTNISESPWMPSVTAEEPLVTIEEVRQTDYMRQRIAQRARREREYWIMPDVPKPSRRYVRYCYKRRVSNFLGLGGGTEDTSSSSLEQSPPTTPEHTRPPSYEDGVIAIDEATQRGPKRKRRKTSLDSISHKIAKFFGRKDSTQLLEVSEQIERAQRARRSQDPAHNTAQARRDGVANISPERYLDARPFDGPSNFYDRDSFHRSSHGPPTPTSMEDRSPSSNSDDPSSSETSLGHTRFQNYQRHSTNSPDPAVLRGRRRARSQPSRFRRLSDFFISSRRRAIRHGKRPVRTPPPNEHISTPYEYINTPYDSAPRMTPMLELLSPTPRRPAPLLISFAVPPGFNISRPESLLLNTRDTDDLSPPPTPPIRPRAPRNLPSDLSLPCQMLPAVDGTSHGSLRVAPHVLVRARSEADVRVEAERARRSIRRVERTPSVAGREGR